MQEASGCNLQEFVGTAALDTIGLVISGVGEQLHTAMGIPKEYKALGALSARTGAAGQITAIDDAVKSTNTKVLEIHLPRDTKGGAGHGCYILLGGENSAEARRAIEIALNLTNRNCGEVYANEAGHLELAYSARAGEALNMAFGTPIGEAFAFLCAAPAAVGLVMNDRALKASHVNIVKYMNPSFGTTHTNEVNLAISGDASAVKEALIAAREAGLELLRAMGREPKSMGEPFIF